MISISIFSLMMLSAFEVYAQVMTLSRKLEVQREVQESARAITEAIAKDVREKGFVISDHTKLYQTWAQLIIQSGAIIWAWPSFNVGYFLKEKDVSGSWFASCSDIDTGNCILTKVSADNTKRSLVSDRVRVTSLTFEEMGENVGGAGGIGGGINVGISTLPKVRLLMTLEARPGSGLSQELIESTKLHIDTVFSTKMYKAD